jgi:putative phosphoribosyl transferase
LPGILSIPEGAQGVVAFAHGGGSGRLSPRNQFVAARLQEAGLATLLFDLLEEEEGLTRTSVFDIELLASRLHGAAEWLSANVDTRRLTIGYFGANTGAAAALVAAARHPAMVGAVVSRGGRPDLARPYLPAVMAPTLLIVGANDDAALRFNREALRLLQCPKELTVVPGATHLFPEPGALERVARLARDWFCEHLVARRSRPSGQEERTMASRRDQCANQPATCVKPAHANCIENRSPQMSRRGPLPKATGGRNAVLA